MAERVTSYLSIRMVSELLQVSRTEVYRLVSKGYLKQVHIAERPAIIEESVEKYIVLREQIRHLEKQMRTPLRK
jgi:predicted DNA-binding transcriptional regulator AlpA